MEMDKDLIRRIIEFDSELHFQTQFLRKPEEQPFLLTQEWLKSIVSRIVGRCNAEF